MHAMSRVRSVGPLFVAVGLLGVSSCATVDPQPEWNAVEGIARERTGVTPVWERSDGDVRSVAARTGALLADGLAREDAVQIALLNNPDLQASFQDLGASKADRVQAGLYTNPQLNLFIALPLNTGDSVAALAVFLSDLWTIPQRERIAAASLAGTIQRVAMAVVDTAADATEAYDTVLYRATVADLTRAQLGVAREQEAHPRKGQRSVDNDHSGGPDVIDLEIAAAQAERDFSAARVRLDAVLALVREPSVYRLTGTLDGLPPDTWTTDAAVGFALEHRLDLAWGRTEVDRRASRLDLERASIFPTVAVGPGYNGGLGTDDAGGPAVSMEVPIFDQNQAQISKAEFRLRRAQLELEAAEVRARAEVTTAVAEIAFRRKQVELLERRSNRSARRGERDPDARLQAISAELERVRALWQLRRAESRLHRALWGGSGDHA